MINRILMELYDDYCLNNNYNKLSEFANKTFGSMEARYMFIGSTLILFSIYNNTIGRGVYVNRENLLNIVNAANEKVGNTNLLKIYVDRINTQKGITKVFNKLKDMEAYDKGAKDVIGYLEQFKPIFIEEIKKHSDKINDYLE